MFFKWKDEYGVGIDEIDQQHSQLIDLINDLYVSIYENNSAEITAGVLRRLKEYTSAHFSAEKQLMSRNHYTGIENHLLQHDEMIVKLDEVETKYKRGQHGLTAELIIFLRNWLAEHICESDKIMARSISARN